MRLSAPFAALHSPHAHSLNIDLPMPEDLISFVVPAYNEEAFIGDTLLAIHDSARAVGEPYEIVVANDNSTDRTVEIAERHGARIVHVHHRQIAGTRNSGARAANGTYLCFVDADTRINPRTLGAALRHMKHGAMGGGATVWFERGEALPAYVRPGYVLLMFFALLNRLPTASFMFCTRDAFVATGGFPEDMFWAEETPFANALKREGSFVVPWYPVITSGRRFRKPAKANAFTGMGKVLASPRKLFTDRAVVENAWYGPERSSDNIVPYSLNERISQLIWLLIVILGYIGIIWSFLPWTPAPWPGALGELRTIVTILLSHIGLAFLPIAALAVVNVLRQKKPTDLLRSLLSIAFAGWLGWNAACSVVRTYGQLWHWLSGA